MRDRTGESFAGRGPGARDDLSLPQASDIAAASAAFAAGRIDRRRLLKFAGPYALPKGGSKRLAPAQRSRHS